MDWIGMSFSIIGLYYLPSNFRAGMGLFIIGNILWVTYAVPNGAWSVVAVNSIFLILNIRGFLKGNKNAIV